METPLIPKKQFNKIKKQLPVAKHARALDDRKVPGAIILVIRHGLPWRPLPDFYGKCSSIHCKFRRGQRHDVKVVPKLIERNKMKQLVADKVCGSQSFRKQLGDQKIEVCIQPKSNEKNPATYDRKLYKKTSYNQKYAFKIKGLERYCF